MDRHSPVQVERFIALDAQVRACNLTCPYCYVPRKQNAIESGYPSQKLIGMAFSPKRLGGTAYIYMYASGEPMLCRDAQESITTLLGLGHYVGVTSNLTPSGGIRRLVALPAGLRKRLVVFASLHYLEMKQRGLLGAFFERVRQLRESGSSCIMRLCIAPDYLPYVQEIRERCLQETGTLPVAAHYVSRPMPNNELENKLRAASRQFPHDLFDFQSQIHATKVTDFCHAGESSYVIRLRTGEVKACLCEKAMGNIYDDPNIPLPRRPVGNACSAAWCMCGAHFLPWGVLEGFPHLGYAELFSGGHKVGFQPEIISVFNSPISQCI